MGFSRVTPPLTLRNGYVLRCSFAYGTNVSNIPVYTCRHADIDYAPCPVIPSDYSGQLTYLLRYPSTPGDNTADTLTVHHTTLLLRQALTLQMSPSPTTGVSIIHENRNLLGIPVEVPEPPPPPARRRPKAGGRGPSFSAGSSAGAQRGASAKFGHLRQQSNPMALPEMLARGLLERGESLGINKTVMNAVSELKVRGYPGI